MTPSEGDRIRVTGIMDDPCPMEVGSEGTVHQVTYPGTPLEQIWVKWDNPSRNLMLLPGDPFEVIR